LRSHEIISVSFYGNSYKIIRSFLKTLNEDNYAFFYSDQTLIQVVVIESKSRKHTSSNSTSPVDSAHPVKFQIIENKAVRSDLSTVAIIRDVIENSIAHEIGLKKGDIILEYDHIQIHHFNRLMNEIQSRLDRSEISMLVVREKRPIRLSCRGGSLGIVMSTGHIPREEFEMYLLY